MANVIGVAGGRTCPVQREPGTAADDATTCRTTGGRRTLSNTPTEPEPASTPAKSATELIPEDKVLPAAVGGNLTVDVLAGLFRDGGFSINRGRRQTTATWGPVRVKVSGSNYIREIFVTGEASSTREQNALIAMSMQIALGATVSWCSNWVTDNLAYAISRASESGTKVYAKNDLRDDVFVRLEVDLGKRLVTLEIEPYEKGVSF